MDFALSTGRRRIILFGVARLLTYCRQRTARKHLGMHANGAGWRGDEAAREDDTCMDATLFLDRHIMLLLFRFECLCVASEEDPGCCRTKCQDGG